MGGDSTVFECELRDFVFAVMLLAPRQHWRGTAYQSRLCAQLRTRGSTYQPLNLGNDGARSDVHPTQYCSLSRRVLVLDRVDLTGFRPLGLPHHRTCGFPHTAVESGGLR